MEVFVRVPESKRNSKWDRKADLGILICYDVVGYRVLIGNKVIVARHFDVIEEDIKCIGFNDIDEGNENNNDLIPPPTSTLGESRESKTDLKNLNENLKNNENVENEVEEVPEIRRSQRNIKKPSRFDDNYVYNGCIWERPAETGHRARALPFSRKRRSV